MRVPLAYGRHGLTVDLADSTFVVAAPFAPGLQDEAAAIRDALRQPIGSAPLAGKVKPGDKVVVTASINLLSGPLWPISC